MRRDSKKTGYLSHIAGRRFMRKKRKKRMRKKRLKTYRNKIERKDRVISKIKEDAEG